MGKNNYVNNKDFYAALVERKALRDAAEAAGKEGPPLTDYLGSTLMDICTHFSYRPNFINYSFRDEMIGDAIENCIKVVDNFDTTQYSNPFAYFTQIAFFAFLRRIASEHKQQYIKFKLLEELPMDEMIEMTDADTGDAHFKPAVEFLRDHSYFNTKEYEDKIFSKRKIKTPIENLLECDE